MGSFIRLPPHALDGRIDATYYRPEFVANAHRLSSSSIGRAALSSLVADGRRTLYFGTTTLEADKAPADWVPFLTSDDLGDDGFFVETRARRRVAPSFLADYLGGRLRSGELLVKVKGPNQTTAYVESAPEYPILVSGTIWGGLVRRDVVDPHYLVAALSCPYAAMARTRLRTNLNVEFLGAEDLLSLSLPTPTTLAQRYIGDKIRHAERLRDQARRLVRCVRQHHANHIPSFRPTREKWNTFRLSTRAVDDVIVPHFYPPAVAEYLAGRQSKPLGQLCEAVYSGETYEPDDHGVDQATSRSCSGLFLRRPCNRVSPPMRVDLDLQSHDLLLTNAAHDKGYIGTDVTYYHGGPRNIPSAKVIVLRTDRTAAPASYLFTYLQTPVGYLQIQSAIRGISAGIRAQDVAAIRIPLPAVPEQERAAWFATDVQMADAGAAEEMASLLCTAATLLVERLIDGRIQEADLVAAQQALEAGDRGLDRELLKALRQSGSAGDQPLFVEVDALFALLDSLEEDFA